MKNRIKTIAFVLMGIHMLSYFLIGDFMLEYEMQSNFEKFNERRLSNIYNKNVSEKFYFASCGDEFFRDKESLTDFMEKVNPDKHDALQDKNYYRWVLTLDANHSFTELIEAETTENEDVTCIIFSACRLVKVPFFYTKVGQDEVFSAHTDYHAMMYNDQVNHYEIHYIWFLFKWFKLKTTASIA